MEYWLEDKYIDQQNRIEYPEIEPNIYDELIFNKDGKPIQWGKMYFSKHGTEQLDISLKKIK